MKVVIAIDSFKGSLSTLESGAAVKEALLEVCPEAEAEICPLADGGEGTVRAIAAAVGGELCTVTVTGPLGEPVDAEYCYIPERRTAVIEMAAAAGIALLPEERRNPLYTDTYGVGEIIRHAITEQGCRSFIIGIGGSATNDGGTGMLRALGYRFVDADGADVPRGAVGLSTLARIVDTDRLPELSQCELLVACDVTNPLCGEQGCSAVYGPQKGATPEMIADMDGWLCKYAEMTANLLGEDLRDYPGAGAAGGMGFAFVAYLGATLRSGISLVMDATGLPEKLRTADLVITGEGRLDGQSCNGKAPVGVALEAKKHGKTVIAFSGAVTDDAHLVNNYGIDAYFPILRRPCTLAEAMDISTAYSNLRATARQALSLYMRLAK